MCSLKPSAVRWLAHAAEPGRGRADPGPFLHSRALGLRLCHPLVWMGLAASSRGMQPPRLLWYPPLGEEALKHLHPPCCWQLWFHPGSRSSAWGSMWVGVFPLLAQETWSVGWDIVGDPPELGCHLPGVWVVASPPWRGILEMIGICYPNTCEEPWWPTPRARASGFPPLLFPPP